MTSRVDELVDELHRVMDALGLTVPGALREPSILDEIDSALAPARLPAQVRRLWELVDTDVLGNSVRTHPQLAKPDFCLWSRRNLDEPDDFTVGHPGHFFQVFYTSHAEMSVECDGPGWEGGCLFDWFLSDPGSPFVLRFQSVVDWLEVLLAVLDEGAYQHLGDRTVLVDDARRRQLAGDRLAGQPPHAQYGIGIEIGCDRSE